MQPVHKNHNSDSIVLHPMSLICIAAHPIHKTFKKVF